jgi:hypothetical protein
MHLFVHDFKPKFEALTSVASYGKSKAAGPKAMSFWWEKREWVAAREAAAMEGLCQQNVGPESRDVHGGNMGARQIAKELDLSSHADAPHFSPSLSTALHLCIWKLSTKRKFDS